MSNWFEDNPTKSIIAYTLFIAAATWATSTFVLEDNKLSLARSELETQKSLTEQYKSKTELLQRDIDALRAENVEYRTWLGKTKDAIPIIVPRITALKEKVASLEAESKRRQTNNGNKPESVQEYSATASTAFVDDVTGTVFAVKKTYPDSTADVVVRLPNTDAKIEGIISPGYQKRFTFKNKIYSFIVTRVTFLNDTVYFRIKAND